jgi:hypothetical protein
MVSFPQAANEKQDKYKQTGALTAFTAAFHPKALICNATWQVFWLARFSRPSHPLGAVTFVLEKHCNELTAAGTAPDLHRIPILRRMPVGICHQ